MATIPAKNSLTPKLNRRRLLDSFSLFMQVGRKEPPPVFTPWLNLERYWSEEADQYAEYCMKLATVLLPMSKGLVYWNQFDQNQFRRDGAVLLGEEWETYWSKF